VRAENSESGTHGHVIAVCQIVETTTQVVKWSVVKRNPSVELPFEQDAGQQQISAEQAGVPPAASTISKQRLNSIGRIRINRPALLARSRY
jgi:hypothetical protein